LSPVGQTVQLAEQQIDDVVGVALGANALQIPRPGAVPCNKLKELLLAKGRQELDREKRVSATNSLTSGSETGGRTISRTIVAARRIVSSVRRRG
jgi:hypothetical protein